MSLKMHLGEKRIDLDEEVKNAVTHYLEKEVPASHFDAGVKKLPARLKKCIELNGDYVEK